jgi:hypothetical protein
MSDILLRAKRQPLSSIAGEYYQCTECQVADDFRRNIGGTICPTCSKQSDHGLSFFDLSVLAMIDLLQEAFRAIPEPSSDKDDQLEREHSHGAAVLIYYCIIRELLLIRFSKAMMVGLNLPLPVQERMDADNDTHTARLFKLFPALTGVKWDEALKTLPSPKGYDWLALNQYLETVSKERNKFMHDGMFYKGGRTEAEECVKNLFPLLELFIELNNKFVHPFYM